jgi:hypothetical protein
MEDETQLMKDVRRTLNAMRNYEQVSSKRERLTNIQQTIRYLREQPPAQPFANALQFPNVDFTQPLPLAQETISPLVATANVAKPPSPQPERKVESSERKVESSEIKKEIPIAAKTEVPNPFLEKPAEIAKSEEIKTEPKPNVDIIVKNIVDTSKYLLTFQFTYVALVMHLRGCLFQRSKVGKEIISEVQKLLEVKSDDNLALVREYLSLAWAKMLPFSAVWNPENTGFISTTLILATKAKEMTNIELEYNTLAGKDQGQASLKSTDEDTLNLYALFSKKFVYLIGGVQSRAFAKTTGYGGYVGRTPIFSYDKDLVTSIWKSWLSDFGTLLGTEDAIEQLTKKIDNDTNSWFNFKIAWAETLKESKKIETTPLCKDFFGILNVLSQETIPKWTYTEKECKTETHFDLIMEIGNIVKIGAVDPNSPKDVQNKIRCGLQSAFSDIFSAAMIEWSKHIFVNPTTGNFMIDDSTGSGLTKGWASKLFGATGRFLSYFSTG